MVPIFCLAVLGLLWMGASSVIRPSILMGISIAFFVLAFLGFFVPISVPMLSTDSVSISFGLLVLVTALLGFLMFWAHGPSDFKDRVHPIALLVFASSGALVMSSWTHFLTLFLGIEILSLPFYALAASSVACSRSQEAGIKYVLLGAFSSAIFLFGMGLFFVGTGSFSLDAMLISAKLYTGQWVVFAGLLMMLSGLLFKAGVVPFHAWVPDVYEGAPTVYVGWMGALVKIAVFAALLRFLMPLFPVFSVWGGILGVCCVLTMFLGNGLAFFQSSLKRLFAYSGIAHGGYLLMALLPASPVSVPTILVYIFSYFLAVLGAFWVIILLEKEGLGVELSALKGLWSRSKLVFFVLFISVFSMAGLPPLAGFFAKLGLILHVFESGFFSLAVLAFVNFLMAIAYYTKVLLSTHSDMGWSSVRFSLTKSDRAFGILILFFQILISISAIFIL